MKSRILVIDDESAIRDSLKMILEYDGYDVQGAATGQDGLVMVDRDQPELVLLDIKMAGMDGLEVLQRLKAGHDALPVVMISGHATVSTAVEATKLGAFDFIEKPLSTERVLVTVRNALDRLRLVDENVTLRKAQEVRHQLVGDSSGLRGTLDAVKRAAPTSATVLITGESGVGKELVARAIHRNSLRARERFIQVNCAAIPDDLIESELFGHEKGSFTGAMTMRKGRFETANKGTIFLDEIGEMTLATQTKLLRILQEREFERIGSNLPIKIDIRVITATNRDLEDEVEGGRFREDLYYRLNVIHIHMPPLRERKEDIPLLVEHFLVKYRYEPGAIPTTVTEDALTRLVDYDWPGNVRELENAIERAVVLSRGNPITVEHLPFTKAPKARGKGTISQRRDDLEAEEAELADRRETLAKDEAEAVANGNGANGASFKDQVASLEKQLIKEALDRAGGNRTKAADELGIYRRLLYAKIKEYGLE